MPPKKDKKRQPSAEDDSNDGETGGEMIPSTGPSTSLVPGFSAEQVNSLATYLSAMMNSRLEAHFRRFDETC